VAKIRLFFQKEKEKFGFFNKLSYFCKQKQENNNQIIAIKYEETIITRSNCAVRIECRDGTGLL
jgi:hypothetical protein